jgi:hypothetical protein
MQRSKYKVNIFSGKLKNNTFGDCFCEKKHGC